jgi:dCMP deaminase
MNKRASWDEYFLRLAVTTATRSTCDRKHVGAVIVRDKSILGTGYNGSIRGLPHCDDIGHLMEGGHCVRTVHAEANAVAQAARNGVRIDGGTIYVTALPCWLCLKLIANAGIVRVVFGEAYGDSGTIAHVLAAAADAGIAIDHLPLSGCPVRGESGAAVLRLKPNSVIGEEVHPNHDEAILVIRGCVLIDGRVLHPGESGRIPASTPHTLCADADEGAELVVAMLPVEP